MYWWRLDIVCESAYFGSLGMDLGKVGVSVIRFSDCGFGGAEQVSR